VGIGLAGLALIAAVHAYSSLLTGFVIALSRKPRPSPRTAAHCSPAGRVTDADGTERDLEGDDIVVVAPYNLARRRIAERVPAGVRLGTVDKFQGLGRGGSSRSCRRAINVPAHRCEARTAARCA
jgi:hypothetical protein